MRRSTSSKILKKISTSLVIISLITSCNRVSNEKLEPQICYNVQDTYVKNLSSPFPSLSREELATNWGREYEIGTAFAKELDLYRAITAFRRSAILLGTKNMQRLQEAEYNIILSYYLGRRYEEVLETFTCSHLRSVNQGFPAYHDLLVILYEANVAMEEEMAAETMLNHIKKFYPETGSNLELSTALKHADFPTLEKLEEANPKVAERVIYPVMDCYESQMKSITKAETLNALIPGAGYLYVGQKGTALTAFLLNGLFIGAATYFFLDGNIAAGLITTSFEAGWYFGGIYGAGEAAKLYNERKYENCAYPYMAKEKLFPILTLRYAF